MTAAIAWLRRHDPGASALRRAARTAVVMPGLFAFGSRVLDDPILATFAAFGSFAMLLLADFSGPRRDRLFAQFALVLAGTVGVCLGTLSSRHTTLAVAAMVVVGFAVLFAGVVSSVVAGATTAVLLGFVLPVTQPGGVSAIPARAEGWLLAGGVSLIAITLLWPAPVREPLRVAASSATRALAARVRAEAAFALAGRVDRSELDAASAAADTAVAALRTVFLATPYRPTALGTSARMIVRLVDEIGWLRGILDDPPAARAGPVDPAVCAVKQAAADVLDRCADLLAARTAPPDGLLAALDQLAAARDAMEGAVLAVEPAGPAEVFLEGLAPSFRAQELTFAISAIAGNVVASVAAARRSAWHQLLGRQPEGVAGPLAAARERAGAHIDVHSVWLHNSIRGAIALGGAVLVAELTGVQHSFWVVLGTLSVLRSNALSTGQNVLRGLLGTVIGFAVGGLLVAAVGTDPTVLWILLPVAVLVAGVAPAISFAAGQAGFTLTLLILFNIISPAGWRVGLVRIEDVAIGCVVSLLVGALFWPRGAVRTLGSALAEAYAASAAQLEAAIGFGTLRGGATTDGTSAPDAVPALSAAAAARRLDDAFRGFLAERGAKHLPLAQVTVLLSGVAALRLSAAAVLDLWQRAAAPPAQSAAPTGLPAALAPLAAWYDELAAALAGQVGAGVPPPLPERPVCTPELLRAVQADLTGSGPGPATAVRIVWSADHLDALRRLQPDLVGPARVAAAHLRGRSGGRWWSSGRRWFGPAPLTAPQAVASTSTTTGA